VNEVTLGQVISVAETFRTKVEKDEIRAVYNKVFNPQGTGIDPQALMIASRNMREQPLSLDQAKKMIAWLQQP